MYEAYWGLSRMPFQNVPDPTFFCPLPAYQEILEKLLYVVQYSKGAALLTGNVGCGKSTLSRVFILHLEEEKYDVGLVINPSVPSEELLYEVALQLGLSPPSSHRPTLFRSLYDHLLANAQEGKVTVIIIDEAQTIKDESVFEDLRVLLNFQLNDRYLFSLILLGLPELKVTLARLPPLNQRIALHLNLSPLNQEETALYIDFRLKKAGQTRRIFTNETIKAIHQEAGGLPRSINNLCDLCLFEGMRRKAKEVDALLVKVALALT
ncbi:MAG: AAA family ATPase [candidate division NC10 bacterium]|nr:AAA family ATPase [candidate division NC10 bacterium]